MSALELNDYVDDIQPSSSGAPVAIVAGRRLAAGLIWEFLPDGRPQDVAREMARQERGDLFVMLGGRRATDNRQIGIGFSSEGHKAGAQSVAGLFAQTAIDSQIGAFELDDGRWWMGMAEKGIVLADGDRLFDREDDARREFRRLYDQSRFAIAFAPYRWKIEGTDENTLAAVLGQAKGCRLQTVATPRERMVRATAGLRRRLRPWHIAVAAAVLIALAGAGGWLIYQAHLEAERRAALHRKVVSERAKQLKDQAAAERQRTAEEEARLRAYPRPWHARPTADSYIAACVGALKSEVGPYNMMVGWRMTTASCRLAGIVLNYERAPQADIAAFRAATGADIEPGGQKATRRASIAGLEARGDEPALDRYEIKLMLANAFNRLPVRMSLSDSPPPPKPKNGEKVARQATFVRFSIVSSIRPTDFAPRLALVPGTVIEAVDWRAEDNVWKVDGKVYERAPEERGLPADAAASAGRPAS